MANYNDLKERFLKTGQNAVQKTKDFAEITKLNQSISELERQNKEMYIQIGKAYYQKYAPECTDPEIIGQIGQLDENIRQIAEKQKQIRTIKGVTSCPNCGAELQQSTTFCTNCGAQLIRQTAAPQVQFPEGGQNHCASCGAILDDDAKFCIVCGAKTTA